VSSGIALCVLAGGSKRIAGGTELTLRSGAAEPLYVRRVKRDAQPLLAAGRPVSETGKNAVCLCFVAAHAQSDRSNRSSYA
jgi:hypothetical protein